jgi:uncharacterized protein (TIGR02466 family)
MIESKIQGIFPTPIYFSSINKKLNKKELLIIKNSKITSEKNDGNTNSANNYILEKKEFKDLKKKIELLVQDYFDQIICTENEIYPYITQSWLNFTETKQHHHKHSHPNSFLSGVFYINADEKFDKIYFYNDKYDSFRLETKKWNLWNSTSWWFPVKTGDIIIFPSSLTHAVETKQGDNTRTSLAFNVFIKGTIGNNKSLTELHLK